MFHVVDTTLGLPHTAIDPLLVSTGALYNDSGATAVDNVDGNITSSLSTYGVGAVSTSLPTGTAYFTITYTVQVGHQSLLESLSAQ